MSDPIPAEARAANLRLWNARARVQEKSAFYGVEGFKAGDTFYMAEIHPFACGLDEVPGEHDVRVKYRLLPAPDQPVVQPVDGSYADAGADTTDLVSYGWSHSFAEILGALTGAGLRVKHLHFPAELLAENDQGGLTMPEEPLSEPLFAEPSLTAARLPA